MIWSRIKYALGEPQEPSCDAVARAYGAFLSKTSVGPLNPIDASSLPFDMQIIKAALVECANHPSASSEQINALGICYISLADFVENLSERTLRGGLHLAEELNEESRRLWAEWQSMVINNA